jgi:hypothetical protein
MPAGVVFVVVGATTSISRYIASSSEVPFIRERSSLLGPNGQRSAKALTFAMTSWKSPGYTTILVALSSTVIPSGSRPANVMFADPISPP